MLDTTKIIKSQRQPKNLKRILTFSTFGENTTQRANKCKNKRCRVWDIIIEGKYSTFKNPKPKFMISKDLSCNSKNVTYIIGCNKCKEVYTGLVQVLNTRISLHKSDIKIPGYHSTNAISKYQDTTPQKRYQNTRISLHKSDIKIPGYHSTKAISKYQDITPQKRYQNTGI